MLRSLIAPMLMTALCSLAGAAEFQVNVVDSDGVPVKDATIAAQLSGDRGSFPYQVLPRDGVMKVQDNMVDMLKLDQISIIAAAPGKAFTHETYSLDDKTSFTVTLPKTSEFSVRLHDASGQPILGAKDGVFVFTRDTARAVWGNRPGGRSASVNLSPPGEDNGVYTFTVPQSLDEIYVGFNDPNVMRGFASESIALPAKDAVVRLPAPVALKVDFVAAGEKKLAQSFVTVISSMGEGSSGWSSSMISQRSNQPGNMTVELPNLAPGMYRIMAYGSSRAEGSLPQDAEFSGAQLAELEPGQKEPKVVTIAFEPFSEDSLKGDHSATVTLTRKSGNPVAGMDWELVYTDPNSRRNITVAKGTTDDQGKLELKGLAGGRTGAPTFALRKAGGIRIMNVNFPGTAKHQDLRADLPPMEGDVAPDISFLDVATGQPLKLSDFRGQVVFLDFWATWCGPCQEPMQKSNDLRARRTDWKGKAVIVGASCDDTILVLKDHLAKHQWNNVRQVWMNEGGVGWRSKGMKDYAVTGIPTALLIDQEGRIRWRGHPGSFDVEKEIDALIGR